MTRTRLGLLGLCAVVFGLMAFGTAAAHAEVGAKWLILDANKVLREGSTLHASVGLEKDTEAVLHSEILEIPVLFLCPNIEVVNAKLQEDGIIGNTVSTNGSGLKLGLGSSIKFTKCTTHLEGELAPECEPEGPSGEKGVVVTKNGHALLKLHKLANGTLDDVVEIAPDTGETFATIVLPKTCPIGTSVPVIGKLFLRDCNNEGRVHKVKHLVESDATTTNLTKLWTISKTPEHVATLLGSAWAFLTGDHVNLLWSGDPN